MCTVTFIAQQNGYCLGMNRDEKLARVPALPPTKKLVNGRTVVSPSEPSGGTWISLNDAGICFALINWYCVTDRVRYEPISRGEVVKTVSGLTTARLAAEAVNSMALKRINPFRLIGVLPSSQEIFEWRWDLHQLAVVCCPWKTQQWMSSGFDECAAQKIRSRTFKRSLREPSAPNRRWLRELHQSHVPEAGPFSTCVHRPDAGTVSFTEILLTSRQGLIRYTAGQPCAPKEVASEFRLRLLGR